MQFLDGNFSRITLLFVAFYLISKINLSRLYDEFSRIASWNLPIHVSYASGPIDFSFKGRFTCSSYVDEGRKSTMHVQSNPKLVDCAGNQLMKQQQDVPFGSNERFTNTLVLFFCCHLTQPDNLIFHFTTGFWRYYLTNLSTFNSRTCYISFAESSIYNFDDIAILIVAELFNIHVISA